MKKLPLLLGLAALCAWNGNASAQAPTATQPYYEVQEMNFDMWCQEQQHLPPARCDKRLPQDDAAFQAYVNTVERYETQQLNQAAQERRLERLLKRSPVDNSRQPAPSPTPPTPQ